MISVKNLQFTYPGASAPTIKNIDFTVNHGEIFGFLGPSGAGKSTTQKILNGIMRMYQGEVIVEGQEIRTITPTFYHHIGVVFEFPNIYTRFTALENLCFFGSLYGGARNDPMLLLQMVGLEKDANTRVSEFSKGMKMRLNFCRGLLNRPKLLFLDEPTSGLDPVNSRKVKDIILRLKDEGTTIFLTTHNMHDAEDLCDRVAFMVEGKLALIDTPRNLKIKHGTSHVKVEYRQDQALQCAEFALKDLGNNHAFLTLLAKHQVETIHSQEASLERIFIAVTGRSLS